MPVGVEGQLGWVAYLRMGSGSSAREFSCMPGRYECVENGCVGEQALLIAIRDGAVTTNAKADALTDSYKCPALMAKITLARKFYNRALRDPDDIRARIADLVARREELELKRSGCKDGSAEQRELINLIRGLASAITKYMGRLRVIERGEN